MGAVLAIMLAGCSAMLAGVPVWRAAAPTALRPAHDEVAPSSTGVDQQRAEKGRIEAMLGNLPLYFVRNRGQEDSRVAYYLQGHNAAVYFGSDGITFALTGARSTAGGETLSQRAPVRPASTRPERTKATERWAVKLDFVGANRVTPTGQELTPAVVSYFKGRDSDWNGSLETYRGVTYPDLWPGIDLVYTGTDGQLKSTFIVKPGADPSRIRLAYRGALVTAEVPAAATLLEALRGAPDRAARRGLAAAAGRAVAGLHAAGVFHADLNLSNILVHPGPEGVRAALLDFDRAWLGAPPLRSAARRRNLRRLARSLAKLDPGGQLAGAEERRAFRDAYAGDDPRLAPGDACAC